MRGDTRAWPLRDVAGHWSHLCFKPEGSWLWQSACMQANARLSWGILHCVGSVTDLHSEGFNFHQANEKKWIELPFSIPIITASLLYSALSTWCGITRAGTRMLVLWSPAVTPAFARVVQTPAHCQEAQHFCTRRKPRHGATERSKSCPVKHHSVGRVS